MKITSFALTGAASLLLLSGCVPTASKDADDVSAGDISRMVQAELKKTDMLSESQVREIIQEELTNANFATAEMVDQKVAEKVVGDALQMTDEDFNAKVAAGIEAFIAEQEEAARKAAEEANKPQKIEGVTADDDPFLGDVDASVTIIEFSDFECPFCAKYIAETYPKIKENYIDTGKVKYVFRDFPLGFHANAMPAAVAANCVLEQEGNETYFAFHDKLFENQQNLTESAFKKYAKELGLDEAGFAACLEAGDTAEIEADMEDGAKVGVSGTPGFFINGWQIKGAYPYEHFEQLIEQELAAQ